MSDALISRVLKTCGADIVQATGNSSVDVMSQKACTDNFSLLQHTHAISDLTSGVLEQSKGGTGTSNFYEKGSWTPTIGSTGSTSPTVSYGYRYGIYYRIGNLVYIACHLKMNISSAGSNYACINGLPYACASGSDKYGLSLVEDYKSTKSGDDNSRGVVVQGTTRIDLRGESGSFANTWATESEQYIGYSGCYIKT